MHFCRDLSPEEGSRGKNRTAAVTRQQGRSRRLGRSWDSGTHPDPPALPGAPSRALGYLGISHPGAVPFPLAWVPFPPSGTTLTLGTQHSNSAQGTPQPCLHRKRASKYGLDALHASSHLILSTALPIPPQMRQPRWAERPASSPTAHGQHSWATHWAWNPSALGMAWALAISGAPRPGRVPGTPAPSQVAFATPVPPAVGKSCSDGQPP